MFVLAHPARSRHTFRQETLLKWQLLKPRRKHAQVQTAPSFAEVRARFLGRRPYVGLYPTLGWRNLVAMTEATK